MQNGKHVILCVDDDRDILEAAKVILESDGYVFAGASSAEEGLKAYDRVKPDLMIVDLMMEEVDSGTGLVRELKARGNKVPVFMLSSVGDSLNQTTDYSDLGLAGVFQKPFDARMLLSTVAAKLGKKRK
ncbi:MAG TPA: response regulator [Planctomycetota bacterium]|nr:response regulator [Planctomycetota bacterium]